MMIVNEVVVLVIVVVLAIEDQHHSVFGAVYDVAVRVNLLTIAVRVVKSDGNNGTDRLYVF